MHIAIGSDHRGFQIKNKLVQLLANENHTVDDCGTTCDSAVDYPDFANQVGRLVSEGVAERGILICGTGIGMAITANKFCGVRAAACSDEIMVETCRRHNDVNILCLPGDLIGDRPVDDLIRIFLATSFDGGRHQRRVEKIEAMESQR